MLSSLEQKFPNKTYLLGQVFQNTTNSYKFTWFLSILSLLSQKPENDEFTLQEIFVEMIILSWQPVAFFRLSLGRQDRIANIIFLLKEQFDLADNTSLSKVRKTIFSSKSILKEIEFLKANVPIRFLSPWLHPKVNKESICMTSAFAKESQCSMLPTPYYFCKENSKIKLNQQWQSFFMANLHVIQSFAEHKFTLYLQARNPNSPNIINKLRVPLKRKLDKAKKFWKTVECIFKDRHEPELFLDIYTERPIVQEFSIDHFLPWSFVVHDLTWNLTPTSKSINSSKSNMLPNLKLYIPRLSLLHYNSIRVLIDKPRLLEDYSTCFQERPEDLIHMGKNRFEEKFSEVLSPLEQIAKNQGFRTGWVYK